MRSVKQKMISKEGDGRKLSEVIERFSPENLRRVREAVEKQLQPLADLYGMEIQCLSTGCNEYEAELQLTFTKLPQQGKSAEQVKWERFASRYGMKPEDFGKLVHLNGRDYTIVGLDTKARKNNVLLSRNGRRYKAQPSDILGVFTPGQELPLQELQSRFRNNARYKGLEGKLEYGQTIIFHGEEHRVIDINIHASKYPIVIENMETGKKYRIPISSISGLK